MQSNRSTKTTVRKVATTAAPSTQHQNNLDHVVHVYPFQWNYGDENDLLKSYKCTNKVTNTSELKYEQRNVIRIWGCNKDNESVCVRIEDFRIPMWIELPTVVHDTQKPFVWTQELVDKLLQMFRNGLSPRESKGRDGKTFKMYPPFSSTYLATDQLCNRLYENEFLRNDAGKLERKQYYFLRLSFTSSFQLKRMVTFLEQPLIFENTSILLRCHCASPKLTPVMKLLAMNKLPSSNWITVRGKYVKEGKDRVSNKQHEYVVSWQNISPHVNPDTMPMVYPKVCSFDIETFSSQFPKFPNPSLTNDRIIVIGFTFAFKGKVTYKCCLSLSQNPESIQEDGQCETCFNEDGDSYDVLWYKSENALLAGWSKIINEHDPDVLLGYNIFKFDLTFMYARAQLLKVEEDFLNISCCKIVPGTMGGTSWESEARGKVEMRWIDAQGRLFIDLYTYVQATENLQSYKLDFVASKFLGMQKDPISPRDIFDSWNNRDHKLYNDVIKYCAQDTMLPFLLFEKLLVWLGLTESATVNKVPVFTMVTQGQQIKAYSQVFDFCFHNNLVCNPPERRTKPPYRGAFVAEPVPGIYKMILPFDFASLYPSIIIAHNLDFSTFVKESDVKLFKYVKYDEDDPRYVNNDNEIECFEWEDHVDCRCPKDENLKPDKKPAKTRLDKNGEPIVAAKKKSAVCAAYKYWFLKPKTLGQGVIPTIITQLLAARKKVRKVIEAHEDKIHELEESMKLPETDVAAVKAEIMRLKELNKVLDKRQLAFKVNANSMYGMYGVETGYLPFFAGAETVTYVGRRSIKASNKRLKEKHGGDVIYNDTDSAYVHFTSQANKTVDEVWQFANDVVDDIASLFPPPMKLEFEGKIYVRFMIFKKKKYVAQMLDQHGKLKENMYMRGVPLVQRGYCDNMKEIYEAAIRFILNNIDIVSVFTKEMKANHGDMKKHEFFRRFYMLIFQHLLNVMSRNTTKQVPEVAIEEFNEDDSTVEPGSKRRRITTPATNTLLHDQPVVENDSKYYKEFVIYRTLKQENYAVKAAHAEVANKIRARGTPVDANTRIEYVLLSEFNGLFTRKKKQYEIADDLAYFLQFREVLRMDFLKYFDSQYVNYLNHMSKTIFGIPDAVTEMFKRLQQKNAYINELKARVQEQSIVKAEEVLGSAQTIKSRDLALSYKLFDKSLLQWANLVHKEVCQAEFKLDQHEYVCPDTLLCEQYVRMIFEWFERDKRDVKDLYDCLHEALVWYPDAEVKWIRWVDQCSLEWSEFQSSDLMFAVQAMHKVLSTKVKTTSSE